LENKTKQNLTLQNYLDRGQSKNSVEGKINSRIQRQN